MLRSFEGSLVEDVREHLRQGVCVWSLRGKVPAPQLEGQGSPGTVHFENEYCRRQGNPGGTDLGSVRACSPGKYFSRAITFTTLGFNFTKENDFSLRSSRQSALCYRPSTISCREPMNTLNSDHTESRSQNLIYWLGTSEPCICRYLYLE